MRDFFRFPHTPHLAWLGEGEPRDDKILDPSEATALLAHELVVEEKVDGANLGLSTTDDGELCVQNRGSYLTPEQSYPQFRTLWPWLAARAEGITDALWPDLMLFGEWCTAVHSVEYTTLPDWFLGFDIYDRAADAFWDTQRRDTLLRHLGLSSVPRIARGRFSLDQLIARLGPSSLAPTPMEGLVVRHEDAGLTRERAKLVRASFTQAIGEHWSRGPLRRNHLAIEVTAKPG